MVSVVNGYVCFSSCDVATAKEGKDPNAPPNTPPDALDIKKKPAFAGQPAAIFDGALKGLANAASPVVDADGVNDKTGQPLVDVLV
jgi:hypothetical protein